MFIEEDNEEVGDEPAVQDNLVHIYSHTAIRTRQDRTWRTRWSRLREMIVRSREPLGEATTDEYYSWKGDEEGRGQIRAKILRKGNRTTKRYSRTVSCVKGRFRKLLSRIHRPSSSVIEESNTDVAMDANRNEHVQVLSWQNICDNENDSIESPEDISDCLFLKGPSKYDESWIPKMMYKVINCSWYWGEIDRFEAAVVWCTHFYAL